MKLTYQNQELKVKFFYPEGKQGLTTECLVLRGKPDSLENQKTEVGRGFATRFHRDTPNLVLARTVALLKALSQANYSLSDATQIIENLGIRYTNLEMIKPLMTAEQSIDAVSGTVMTA